MSKRKIEYKTYRDGEGWNCIDQKVDGKLMYSAGVTLGSCSFHANMRNENNDMKKLIFAFEETYRMGLEDGKKLAYNEVGINGR